jgi:cystathionine beta-lyase/cystathionine gamma-synthase
MLRGETPGYFYMRASNPTTRQLELTLAALQDRDDCLATASGVNAIWRNDRYQRPAAAHFSCSLSRSYQK